VRRLFRFLFILYCLEVGLFLVLAPWSGAWERMVSSLAATGLDHVLLQPVARGAVTGFGLVHLVWSAHDSLQWLYEWRSRGSMGA
jgi:hypothetical protein